MYPSIREISVNELWNEVEKGEFSKEERERERKKKGEI